ncbi:carboxylating nicotinate-nucleotide diphosphorylase [candidate division KSB1 bacterium]|nr:carboxylating nicotinate-nucleotide diphosphorylase [candidate division KSB1 bacterium]
MKLNWDQIEQIIQNALQEDLGTQGDLTTHFALSDDIIGKAQFVAKEKMILGGLPVVERVFHRVDSGLVFDAFHHDGDSIDKDTIIAEIFGDLRSILTAERTALNFLQRLCGIATLTRQYVDAVKSTNTIILDTRKTTPQLRSLEKYAVRMGGGKNHRFGLFDLILIKDNHIAAAGGVEEAISRCRDALEKMQLNISIEVEVQNIDQLKEVLEHKIQQIMLDNMDLEEIQEAVKLIDGKVKVEASGNVSLSNVTKIAETGVDYISVGALTHSVKAADISLQVLQ